ncbi:MULTISPECIES: hypothetical protein [unclassified Bosea (in: a-proteobacteria)]|nr:MULTISPECIES: hypothetical protein [unclassified Bosea (in: a-proteobacteria)]
MSSQQIVRKAGLTGAAIASSEEQVEADAAASIPLARQLAARGRD